MPAIGFGDRAQAWASRFASEPLLIVCEADTGREALRHAYDVRSSGGTFYASIVFGDRRAFLHSFLYTVTAPQFPRSDDWRRLFELFGANKVNLDGKSVEELCRLDARTIKVMQDFIALSSGLVVRSWAEYARLQSLLAPRRQPFVALAPDDSIPDPCEGKGDRIAVWAAGMNASALLPHLSVMEDLGLPSVIVGAIPDVVNAKAEFVSISQARAALASSRLIVDATLGDPASTIALARWRRPLVAESTNGAQEFLPGLYLYDTSDRRSLNVAVGDALGGLPPGAATLPAKIEPPSRPSIPGGARPLVSVVISTYNRPRPLSSALRSVARQTYDNVETIVVNDAGTGAGHLAVDFPSVKLISLLENRGPFEAKNAGLRAARGEWIALLDDDDEWFDDHLEQLVATALRSNERIVAGQSVVRYVKPGAKADTLVGLSIEMLSYHDRAHSAAVITLVSPTILIHRSLLEDVGYFDTTLLRASDFDYYFRLSREATVARCDSVTAIYTIWSDRSNRSSQRHEELVAAQREIYRRHPTESPYVQNLREAALRSLSEGHKFDFALF